MAIAPVEAHHVTAVTATLTLAFVDDPVSRWMYPTAEDYLNKFPALVHAFGREAFTNRTARVTDAAHGAALWLPPPWHVDEDALGAIVDEDVPEPIRDEVRTLFGEMDTYHPTGRHWHLPLIGVEPARRGQGLGSALLREALARCDDEHLPVYLESTNPKNVPFYQRHGFERMGTIRAGSAPPMVPMLRPAR